MTNLKKLSNAIRFALFVGTASMVAAPAFAQDQEEGEQTEEEAATTLDRIQVTGSRLKRADIEGALPVTVISREEIEMSGDTSVADIMRDTTFASFGNFRPQSGSSAQSLAEISLRGLGSSRTLVLIDGRRAPRAPSAVGAQNLNQIPLAAVERIEILTDGASAVYGSDAIGGVVNIVLRRDYEGAEFNYGIGRPAAEGGDTEEGSVVFGAAGERGNLIAGASFNSRDIIFTIDSISYVPGISSFGNNWLPLDDEGNATAGFAAYPGYACDDQGFFFSANGLCSYDFNLVAANAAAIDNKGAFARGNFQINDDWSTYMTTLVSETTSFGRYAPTPANLFIESGTAGDPDPDDGLDALVRHRFAAAGNRDNSTNEVLTDLVAGFQGRVADTFDLDVGIRRTRVLFDERGNGYILRTAAEQAIADGLYDLTDPYAADPSVLKSFTVTTSRQSEWQTREWWAVANFDLFEMGGGTSNMAIGTEYREEIYSDNYDSLSEAGVVEGSSGNSAAGTREVHSAFLEWLFPITSTFEATFAGRYDRYSDYGNDFSPKVALRWQPLDNLTFRGSYGEGFRAPGLDILNQATTFSAEPVIDPQTCIAFGGNPDTCDTTPVQVDTFIQANPSLQSEQSTQYSLGVAYDPTDWMNLTLDYYNIEIENLISFIGPSTLIARSQDPSLGPIPPGLSVTRNPVTGAITRVDAGFANEGTLATEGYDFNLRTDFDLGGMGELNNHLQVSYVSEYSFDDGENLTGIYTQGVSRPVYRANLFNVWEMGDWTVGFTTRHIGNQENYPDDPEDKVYVGGYTTHDVSLTYAAPWNADITVGALNVGDKYPELTAVDGRPFNFNLYDELGRTVYMRYSQQF